MLVTNKEVLSKADKLGYAVGSFNINNLESLQAVVCAAEEERSPAIIAVTEGAIDYGGVETLAFLAKLAAKRANVPLTLHLDHGKKIETVKKCLKNGFTSVMIDGSALEFNKNIQITKKVVELSHPKVSVEAELGQLGGVEDYVTGKIKMTDRFKALEFVKKTKVDALAVAIGTSHGAYKFKGKTKLDFKRLKEIKEKTNMLLVLHGASGIPKSLIAKAKRYGAELKGAQGVDDKSIKKAIKLGINKINIDSDLRLAFTASVREFLSKNKSEFDPRKILGSAREAMKDIVKKKMRLFGSANKG